MSAEPVLGQLIPIQHAIRRFRWFSTSFENEVAAKERETNIVLVTSEKAMMHVFLDWHRAFLSQEPHDPSERERFVGFFAGLMLRSMIRYAPVTCAPTPNVFDTSVPAGFWPEGHLYVTYCLSIRTAILGEEFGHSLIQPPDLEDIRTWHSFRENMAEDPSLAVPFLDLFAGETPNWTARDIFGWTHRTKAVKCPSSEVLVPEAA